MGTTPRPRPLGRAPSRDEETGGGPGPKHVKEVMMMVSPTEMADARDPLAVWYLE